MTNVFLALAVIAAIGCGLRLWLPEADLIRRHLNTTVLYVFLPGLIFHVVTQAQLDELFLQLPAMAALTVGASLVLSWVVYHFLPMPAATRGAAMLASSFGNVTYFGLPVLLGIFPQQALEVAKVAVLFEVTKSTLNLTFGSMIAIAYGSHEQITARRTVVEALKLPPLWALAAAVLWKVSGLAVPGFLESATQLLAQSVSGIMILSLGMALRLKPSRLMFVAAPVAVLKLAVAPCIGLGAAALLGLTGVAREAAIIEAAMPSQLLSFVIAGRFQLDEETLSFAILVNTVLSFLTLPLVLRFLGVG